MPRSLLLHSEAIRMDPQQRIFLETAWHALEDAGLTRAQLRGSETSVFVGVHGQSADYGAMQFANLEKLDGYAATGTAHDVIAGRLAYWLICVVRAWSLIRHAPRLLLPFIGLPQSALARLQLRDCRGQQPAFVSAHECGDVATADAGRRR